MGDLIEILRQKAAGQRNKVGDLWADWVCERAADELSRLRAEVETVEWESARQMNALHSRINNQAETIRQALADRDALRRRIAEAPAAQVARWLGPTWVLQKCDLEGIYPPIKGKRVALVRLDAEEGK